MFLYQYELGEMLLTTLLAEVLQVRNRGYGREDEISPGINTLLSY